MRPNRRKIIRFRRIHAKDSLLYPFCSQGGNGRVERFAREGVMKKPHSNQRDELTPLRPVGLAIAAVVAGLGAGKAAAMEAQAGAPPLEPASRENTYFVDHTNHPSFEEDAEMVVGRSAPVAPFGAKGGTTSVRAITIGMVSAENSVVAVMIAAMSSASPPISRASV